MYKMVAKLTSEERDYLNRARRSVSGVLAECYLRAGRDVVVGVIRKGYGLGDSELKGAIEFNRRMVARARGLMR